MKRTIFCLLAALTCHWSSTKADSAMLADGFSPPLGLVVIRGQSIIGALDGKSIQGNVPARLAVFAVERFPQGNGKALGFEHPQAEGRGIKLLFEIAGTPSLVYLDYSEIEQLVGAVNTLLSIDQKPTKLDTWDATYSTSFGLRLVLNPGTAENGRLLTFELGKVVMTVQGAQIQEFRGLVQKAKEKLDAKE